MTNTQARAMCLLVLAFAVVILGFATLTSADELCTTAADIENRDDIRANQKILKENRPAYDGVKNVVLHGEAIDPDDVPGYNAFVWAKKWNEAESAALAVSGCRMDWDTLQLVPLALRP